jgi:ribosomal-protein-alanine N-acetyltransferase
MIRIIDAMEAHLPQVLAIELDAISPPWSEGALTNELGREDGLFFVASEDDGGIVGFCILRRAADEAELYQLATRDDRRRRGIGEALLDKALGDCRARGVASVYLEVRRSNDAAIRLYKKHGFKNEGRRKNYYSSPVEDAVIMTLDLKAHE